jgi:hypothetical protein
MLQKPILQNLQRSAGLLLLVPNWQLHFSTGRVAADDSMPEVIGEFKLLSYEKDVIELC